MPLRSYEWIVGSNGIYRGRPGGVWSRVGRFDFPVNCMLYQPEHHTVFAGVSCGLWAVDIDHGAWRQLHDETLTEVLALAPVAGDPAVVAAFPYGVASGVRDDNGAIRWTSWSRNLRVNERYSNAITTLHAHEYREMDDSVARRPAGYLVGTEAGVLVAYDTGTGWERTSLTGVPVRAVIRALGRYWAGTDGHGIWSSTDGFRWNQAGTGFDAGTAFALVPVGSRILAGTMHGVVVGDEKSSWKQSGPSVLAAAVGVHPESPDTWLVGACPSGLWVTDDSGSRWRQEGTFAAVRAISVRAVDEGGRS